MEIGIAILALGVVVLGYLLLRAKEKLGGFKVTIEKDNVEKEIIEENKNAAWSNLDIVNKLDDTAVNKLLKDKWTRK
jgi:hypothetical protein